MSTACAGVSGGKIENRLDAGGCGVLIATFASIIHLPTSTGWRQQTEGGEPFFERQAQKG